MKVIDTDKAPAAKGTYSQAVDCNGVVYTAGQVGLDPSTRELVQGGAEAQVRQVFENLGQIAIAAGGDLNKIVRLTVYLTDMQHWPLVNKVMEERFKPPYPARTAIGVAALPFNAVIEADAIIVP